jgi:hypothetical protein
MSRFAFPDLARAFRNGERFGDATMRVVEVGDLVLPTGRIVASDLDYTRSDYAPAYTRAVPPGRYPVQLALLGWPSSPANDPFREHVACARVQFQKVPIERWEMALQPGWDPSTLPPGHYFGYGVDGGKGCFVDESAVMRLPDDQSAFFEAHKRMLNNQWQAYQRARANASEEARQALADQADEDRAQTYRLIVPPALGDLFASCTYIRNSTFGPPFRSAVLDSDTEANLICFPSGEGDGCYASYFGLAADGSAACLVTDFGLLVRPVMGTLEIPVPVREHSELTHSGLTDAGIDRAHFDWNPSIGEVVILFEGSRYLQEVRFENRPGSAVRCTVSGGCTGVDETEGRDWFFQLEEPLQPTARVLIGYTLRIEAL